MLMIKSSLKSSLGGAAKSQRDLEESDERSDTLERSGTEHVGHSAIDVNQTPNKAGWVGLTCSHKQDEFITQARLLFLLWPIDPVSTDPGVVYLKNLLSEMVCGTTQQPSPSLNKYSSMHVHTCMFMA